MRLILIATVALLGVANALPVLGTSSLPMTHSSLADARSERDAAWNGGVGDTHAPARPPTKRDAEAWNPQPDPPGRQHGVRDAEAFNPQPDPPGRQHGVRVADADAFNPQPDPPGRQLGSHIVVGTLPGIIELNPQPLPPRK